MVTSSKISWLYLEINNSRNFLRKTLFFFTIHSLQVNDVPLLRDLMNYVKTAVWFRLGLELDISTDDLDIIQYDSSEVENRLRWMFQNFIHA